VPPDEYALVYVAGMEQGVSSGRVPIRVSGEDVTDVVIDAAPPVSIEGAVRVEDSESGSGVSVRGTKIRILTADVFNGPSYAAEAGDDGRLVLENCSPGRYIAEVDPPSGTYVGSVRYGRSDVTGRAFTVSGGGALEIMLRRGSAQLTGRILPTEDSRDGTPGKGAGAYFLVLETGGGRAKSVARFGYSDRSGVFTVTDLAPGEYSVLALATLDPSAFDSPEVLAALARLGTEVELKENDRLAVRVPLVQAEEVERVFDSAN